MKRHNRQFGELEYEADHVYRFPEGVIGFEHLRDFLIIDDEDSQPFRWLVSLEDADLCFPLIHPSLVVGPYDVPVSYDATVFLVAILNEHPEQSTVNLRAPIVINTAERTGRQVILDNDTLSVQHRLFPPVKATGEGAC